MWGWTVPPPRSPRRCLQCWSLQVWGWTVPETSIASIGIWCWSLQVWGWTVPDNTSATSIVMCWSLQVWGWTVPALFRGLRSGSAGASKCGGGQFMSGWWLQRTGVLEPPSVGVDSSLRCIRIRRVLVLEPPSVGVDSSLKPTRATPAGAGASKCGGGQFPVPGNARAVPEPPSVWTVHRSGAARRRRLPG